MGLYLCVFDDTEELDGVDVGSYEDFGFFRDAVTSIVENGMQGSVCPTLINHSDCDGEWSAEQSKHLFDELVLITEAFKNSPAVEFDAEWKSQVAKSFNLKVNNLFDCFYDIDGEPLIDGIKRLSLVSINQNLPILFQ